MVKKGQVMPTTVTPSYRAKISDGKSVRVTTDKKVEASKFYVIQNFFGAAFQSVEKGEDVVLNIEQAEYETDQLAEGDYEVGTPIYFDEGGNEFTANKTNRYAGIVTQERDEDGVILFVLAPQNLVAQSEGGEG